MSLDGPLVKRLLHQVTGVGFVMRQRERKAVKHGVIGFDNLIEIERHHVLVSHTD